MTLLCNARVMIGLAAAVLVVTGTIAPAQRPKADGVPAATGKVVSYQADKAITVEVKLRAGQTKKVEFTIVKGKTTVNLIGDTKAIEAGVDVKVWADKSNPTTATRIAAGGAANAAATPTALGKVVSYQADKAIAVEVKQRGGQLKKMAFAIVKGKTTVQLLGAVKAIEVGTEVRIWADKDDPKTAARIAAGTLRGRPRDTPPPGVRPKPATPTPETVKPPDQPSTPAPAPKKSKRPSTAQAPQAVSGAIDRDIQRVLDAAGVPVSPPADDAEFLRRVYLDITGKIPSPEKALAFLDSNDADKRSRLIDELLASKEYGLHFGDLWCDRINIKDLPIYREPFSAWLADGLNQGRGWDEIVFDLLTAEGQFNFITRGKRLASTEPQALFILLNTEEGMGRGPNPAWLAAESGRLFLGVQLQCAECHDHPFTDSWKQTDFWGLAAFFSRLRMDKAPQGGLVWRESPADGEFLNVVIPATALKNIGTAVPARLLGAGAYQADAQRLLRHELARWMTATDNPYFARAAANRMWAHFFGRGLVNPVDDLHDDNPASHPAVLHLLAEEFKNSGFDLKYLVRCICLSEAYQRTSLPLKDNEDHQDKYSHMSVKVMGPGVFYDCLTIATGFSDLKVGLPERKTKLSVITQFTPREVFVDFYRASQGEEANPLENTHGIPQALKLMNAAQLNGIAPVVQELASLSREQAIERLFLTALTRRPSPAESTLIADFLDRRQDTTAGQGYSAVLWTLINSAEFVSNH